MDETEFFRITQSGAWSALILIFLWFVVFSRKASLKSRIDLWGYGIAVIILVMGLVVNVGIIAYYLGKAF